MNRVRIWLASATLLVCTTGVAMGQEAPQDLSLDLLRPPSMPALNLLGLEAAAISRPSSLSDLAVELQTNTENFTVLPQNLGLAFAPFWLTSRSSVTYDDYASGGWGGDTFLQSLSISVATTNRAAEASADTLALGVGVSFSLLRGSVDEDFGDYRERRGRIVNELGTLLMSFEDRVEAAVAADPVIRRLLAEQAAATDPAVQDSLDLVIETEEDRIGDAQEAALRNDQGALIDRIRDDARGLSVKRKGPFLDVSAGAVWDFAGRIADNKELHDWGAWATGGYEGTVGSALVMFRTLGDQLRNEVMFDLGLRAVVEQASGLSLSAEALHRWDSTQEDGNTWRTAVIAEYSLGGSRVVSVTVGRDFATEIDSEVLAAINLGFGLGSIRPLQ